MCGLFAPVIIQTFMIIWITIIISVFLFPIQLFLLFIRCEADTQKKILEGLGIQLLFKSQFSFQKIVFCYQQIEVETWWISIFEQIQFSFDSTF